MRPNQHLNNANHDVKVLRKAANAVAQRMRHVKNEPLTKENRQYIADAIELLIVKIQKGALERHEAQKGGGDE